MLNRVILIGRLVFDPVLRYTNDGVPVANFSIAVQKKYKNKDGDHDVDYIDIVVWRNLAENCLKHLSKGRLVGVDGSLSIKKNIKDGKTYVNPEVIAEEVQFLDWPGDIDEKED
jgi:single-strand DNA-binding protein